VINRNILYIFIFNTFQKIENRWSYHSRGARQLGCSSTLNPLGSQLPVYATNTLYYVHTLIINTSLQDVTRTTWNDPCPSNGEPVRVQSHLVHQLHILLPSHYVISRKPRNNMIWSGLVCNRISAPAPGRWSWERKKHAFTCGTGRRWRLRCLVWSVAYTRVHQNNRVTRLEPYHTRDGAFPSKAREGLWLTAVREGVPDARLLAVLVPRFFHLHSFATVS
jgi:hypothetical protein